MKASRTAPARVRSEPAASAPRSAEREAPEGGFALELAQSPFMVAQSRAIGAAFGGVAGCKSAPGGSSNPSGLPAPLRAGIEALSGEDLSDVQVRIHSDQPARLDALAFARGNEIHLAPGQERQLPHEAWHVVQQRQGRVRATGQTAGEAINDDPALEAEADRMGTTALRQADGLGALQPRPALPVRAAQLRAVAQRVTVGHAKPIADGPYAWTSSFQIDVGASEVVASIRVQIAPDVGVTMQDIETVMAQTHSEMRKQWDHRFNLKDAAGKELPLRVQIDFVASDPHVTVALHAGTGPDDLRNWYVKSAAINRAHELGHQLGMLDEYVDPKVPNRATATSPGVHADNSLMGNYYTEGIGKATPKQRHGDQLAADISTATGTAFTATRPGLMQRIVHKLAGWLGR